MTNSSAKRAVLFDLDGTLVDTAEDLAAAMNHALLGAGFDAVPAASVRHLVGLGARRMLKDGVERVAARAAREAELDELMDRFLSYYERNIAVHSRPFDGVRALLEHLRANGFATAICTNKREGMAVLLMDTLGLTESFDAIVGADTAAKPKPDAAPARLCLEMTGAARGVFIGDSDTDILTANASGMASFIARFGYGPLTRANEATALFDHYDELADLIDGALA